MNPEETQPQISQGDMTPEEAKAALGLSTRLTEQHLVSQMPAPEAPTSPGSEPGTTEQAEPKEDVKSEIEGLETRIMDELKTLREDLMSQGEGKELAALKKEIEAVLNDDSNESE